MLATVNGGPFGSVWTVFAWDALRNVPHGLPGLYHTKIVDRKLKKLLRALAMGRRPLGAPLLPSTPLPRRVEPHLTFNLAARL